MELHQCTRPCWLLAEYEVCVQVNHNGGAVQVSQEIITECLDILTEVLQKYGRSMKDEHLFLKDVLLKYVADSRSVVRKKTVTCLGNPCQSVCISACILAGLSIHVHSLRERLLANICILQSSHVSRIWPYACNGVKRLVLFLCVTLNFMLLPGSSTQSSCAPAHLRHRLGCVHASHPNQWTGFWIEACALNLPVSCCSIRIHCCQQHAGIDC